MSDPPKYNVAMTMGYLKAKSVLLRTKRALFRRAFWARGYCVSTAGRAADPPGHPRSGEIAA